jgi:hypothetical protein
VSVVIRIEWGDGGDIRSPELRATWCSLSIEIEAQIVTLVRGASGAPRTAIHVSAYPLAEWVVEHWFALLEHQRTDSQPGLRGASMRDAGDGMPWPDLSFDAEGELVRCLWQGGPLPSRADLTFLSSGVARVSRSELQHALEEMVTSVISRLTDAGVRDTSLERRWSELSSLDRDEYEFAVAAAHLGLDPFDTTPKDDAVIYRAADVVPRSLLLPLLDSTDVDHLPQALEWFKAARESVDVTGEPVDRLELDPSRQGYPWDLGYHGARLVREDVEVSGAFPIERFVKVTTIDSSSAGLEAFSRTQASRTGVALPGQAGTSSARFARARALGMWCLFGETMSLLPRTHRFVDKASRAFAAELLIPSGDLRRIAQTVGDRWTEISEEAVAQEYGVSPQVVRKQLENHDIAASY